MNAIDPIDIMQVKTGYYTRATREQQERYPIPVVLFWDGVEGIDTEASRQAFEKELHDRLQDEFPEAMAIEITCMDGAVPRPSLSEVSLTRSSDERLLLAGRWVDALATLVWVRGRWIAPRIASSQ